MNYFSLYLKRELKGNVANNLIVKHILLITRIKTFQAKHIILAIIHTLVYSKKLTDVSYRALGNLYLLVSQFYYFFDLINLISLLNELPLGLFPL